jgi:hypothetical protein
VIVMTSESKNMQGQLDLVWEHLLPAMKKGPLPADPPSQTRLRQTLSGLALTPPKGQPSSPTAARVSGKTFKLESNDPGLQSASFAFQKGACLVTFKAARATYPIACGIERWQRGETALPGTPPRLISGGAPQPGTKHKLAAGGTGKDANTFEMTWRYYETPHHDTVTCRFNGGNVQIEFAASIAGRKRPVLTGQMV